MMMIISMVIASMKSRSSFVDLTSSFFQELIDPLWDQPPIGDVSSISFSFFSTSCRFYRRSNSDDQNIALPGEVERLIEDEVVDRTSGYPGQPDNLSAKVPTPLGKFSNQT